MNRHLPFSRRLAWRPLSAAIAVALALSACGGGGSGGVDTGGTGSYSMGRISGFGSIIVNGVHYDEDDARISDDDDNCSVVGDLKLGMTVAVTAGAITTGADGVRRSSASEIRCISEIKGVVEQVQVGAGGLESFVLLGQTVAVTATTVFDGVGPAALAAGAIVEVYGFQDVAGGRYVATRVELEDGTDDFKLRGLVASHDPATHTFQINGQTISYAGIAATAPSLTDGALVRVELEPAAAGTDPLVAREIEIVDTDIEDRDEAEVEGVITEFTSNASFMVNGLRVDASAATVEDGATLAVGMRVEVEGAIVDGVLVARQVEIEDHEDGDDEDEGFELSGTLAADADFANRTFVLRGVTVSYTLAALKDGLTEAQLVAGARLEVKGVLSGDGATLVATEVERED